MVNKDEKLMYKIIAQKEGITITAETNELTFDEAKKVAIAEVLLETDKAVSYQPFVLLPMTTNERWNERCINFCPRCGANLHEQELGNSEFFDCYDCDSSIEVTIHYYEED